MEVSEIRTYLELFELVFFCDYELMDGIILQSEFSQGVGDFLLFFIARFLNKYESIRGIPKMG